MNKVTVEQIRKIQRFSVVARACCTVIVVATFALTGWLMFRLLNGAFAATDRISIGSYNINGSELHGVGIKTWFLISIAAGTGIVVGMIYLLRGVFANLARGEIFTAANVHRIYLIGVLIFCMGVWQFVVPWVSTIVLSDSTHRIRHYSFWFTPFAVGALIILVSWIMNVGLGVSEEAAELKRDADLVV